MPINRVPVVHKFGIISQTQRVDLEKRIAKKAYLETRRKIEAQQPPEPRPLPFEVTEDFVYKFNDSGQEEREKLEDTAMKMLRRLKRLAGLRQAGEAYHVDLPRAWVDLALLAQCRSSKLEEACLESLIASLDQALVCEEQVLSLFYLAKSGVHWLKKDVGNQSVLRSNEILLLKMTRLVFIRLYCHHLLDQLQEYEDQRTSLGQYLKGFSEKAKSFSQFPGAYLSVRLISEAGRVICSSITTSTKEKIVKNESNTITTTAHDPMNGEDQNQENMIQQMLDTKTDHEHTEEQVVKVEDQKEDERSHAGLIKGPSLQHNVSPSPETGNSIFLQCSLNVWHAVNHDTGSLNHALCDLLESATHLSEEQWLELVLSFHILADASCSNVRVLEAFQYFMSLDFSPVVIPVDRGPHLCETCYSSLPTSPDKKARNSTSFRDNLSKNESVAAGDRNTTTSSLVETLQEFVGLDLSLEQGTLEDMTLRKTQDSATHSSQPRRSGQEGTIPVDSHSIAARTQRRHPRHRWPWELVYAFCECLTTVCMHGACSDVQKFSLLGMSESTFKRYKSGMKSKCGLIEFLQHDDGEDSWKVRYGAVKSLVRVCRYYSNDVTKDGVSNTAWSSLMQHQSTESEPRVLEATKIAKVEAELEKKLTKDHIPTSLWTSRLASALTHILHYQMISTRTHTPTARPTRPDQSQTEKIGIPIPVPSHSERCKKPTLRQDINLSNACLEPRADYNTRQNLELRAVIDDQWKKQLLEDMENEIKTNIEHLDKEREQELKRTRKKNQEKCSD